MISYLIFAAIVSFVTFFLLLQHVSEQNMRRMVGQYLALTDWTLHIAIIVLFVGTGTLTGLLQAELTGVMFSIYLRVYRYLWGFEKKNESGEWVRYNGARA